MHIICPSAEAENDACCSEHQSNAPALLLDMPASSSSPRRGLPTNACSPMFNLLAFYAPFFHKDFRPKPHKYTVTNTFTTCTSRICKYFTTLLLLSCLVPSHANLSYKTPNLRISKPKSNDMPSLLVQMPPLQLNVQFVNANASESVDGLQYVEEALTELAIEVLNSTFVGRLEDVEFNLQCMTKCDGVLTMKDQMIQVQGNATFAGSYYLDDPEEDDVISSLIDGVNNGVLLALLNGAICQANDCLVDAKLETVDSISSYEDQDQNTTDEKQNDNMNMFASAVTNEDDLDSQSKQQSQPNIVSSESRNTENQTDNNSSSKNTAIWITPTVVLSALAAIMLLFIYRRNQHVKQSKEIQHTNTIESSPPSSPSSILKRDADKNTNSPHNQTNAIFNKKSIEQLLQEFATDDISLVSSNPSNEDNASHYSGFSNFSDLDLQKSTTTTQVLNLREAALTSSTLHNPMIDKVKKSNTTYLPCALQKQESFEGTYRTISAMASVLRKDILHAVGENGEDLKTGVGGRTESPKKSMERMEQQRTRERKLNGSGDIAAVGLGRVGIRPASND
jgi:hypothetical protein